MAEFFMKKTRSGTGSLGVRMIGVEPTRREALAPETSVSTISPHPRQKSGCKDMKSFLNIKFQIHMYIHFPTRQLSDATS